MSVSENQKRGGEVAAQGAPAARPGAKAIVEALQAANIELVVGYPGGGTGSVIHPIATSWPA